MELSRFRLGRYIRIVTGHNNLLYHRSNIDLDIDPMCRFCKESQETFLHFISDCPALWREQQQLQADVQDQPVQSAPPEVLLEFAAHPRINAALENQDETDMVWEQEQSQQGEQHTQSDGDVTPVDDPEAGSEAEAMDNEPEENERQRLDEDERMIHMDWNS